MLTTPRAGGKPTRETASDNVLVLVGAVTENQSPPCGSLVLSGPDCKPDQRNPSHLGSANPEGQVHIMADVWSVFDYEVQMFNGLLALCQGNIRNSFQWPIPNAITESLLLHARILTCVLISRGREDDIKLSTLLPGFTVPEISTLASGLREGRRPKEHLLHHQQAAGARDHGAGRNRGARLHEGRAGFAPLHQPHPGRNRAEETALRCV